MHEFSICQSIIQAALDELKKIQPKPAHLTKVRIVTGQYHQLVPDNLLFAYDVLSKNTPAEGSSLEIKLLPIVGQCRSCGWSGEIHKSMYICSACGTADIDVIGGKELYLDSLEVKEHDNSQC